MQNQTFVYVTYIETSINELWDALTKSEFTKTYWSGRHIESDWKAGSPITLIMDDGKTDWYGKILQCEPPKLLSYTFQFEWLEDLRSEPASKVMYELETIGETVKLTVTHTELTEKMFNGISKGWPGILSKLKSMLERGK